MAAEDNPYWPLLSGPEAMALGTEMRGLRRDVRSLTESIQTLVRVLEQARPVVTSAAETAWEREKREREALRSTDPGVTPFQKLK